MASAFEVCRREILRYIEKFGHGRYSDLLRDLPFDDGLIKLPLDKMNESGSDWLYVFYTYPYLTSIMLDDEMVSWSTDSIVGAIKRLA